MDISKTGEKYGMMCTDSGKGQIAARCGNSSENDHYLMMEAVRASETSVCFKETTRRFIIQGCHLQRKF
jgi:hypothetical protein